MSISNAYSDEHRPLAAYGLLTTAFGALFGGGTAALHDRLPERPRATDVALAGVATYKISRLLAKDRVTSVLRAPFTRYEGEAGPSEVSEEPRGGGLRLALGELLVCPYCVGSGSWARWRSARSPRRGRRASSPGRSPPTRSPTRCRWPTRRRCRHEPDRRPDRSVRRRRARDRARVRPRGDAGRAAGPQRARRSRPPPTRSAREGGTALAIPTDVADAEQVEAAAERVERELGPIDVWVNDAMASVFARVWDIEPDEFRRVTEVTYLGAVYGTMAALQRMRPRDRGTIVQVGSALAYRGIPLQSAYCGAKHAHQGLHRVAAHRADARAAAACT